MNPFDYVRPATHCGSRRRRLGAGRCVSGGRHQPSRPDEGRHQPPATARRHHPSSPASIRSSELADGGVRIGALVRNADLAHDRDFARRFPAVAEALLSGASAQLRNAATVGGNLLQRTRCAYFYDVASACNKRDPGAGCDARGGDNRLHAILGWSERCIATHPSDFCVPLVALDAVVEIEGQAGRRDIPLETFHRLPGDAPDRESVLEPGEMIIAVRLPAAGRAVRRARPLSESARAHVVCVRRRVGGGRFAPRARYDRRGARSRSAAWRSKPWRAREAEAALAGARVDAASFRRAAAAALAAAKPSGDNAFKIELARRIVVRALTLAAAGTPERLPALPASPFAAISGVVAHA